MRSLERTVGKQYAVVGDDAHRVAVQPGKAGHQGGAVAGLELVKLTAVDQAGDDFVRIDRFLQTHRRDAVEFLRIVERLFRRVAFQRLFWADRQRLEDIAADLQGVRIILGQVIGYARHRRMHVGSAQFFGRHFLARGGFHQGRTAQKNRTLVAHDDHLVAHRRNVRPARRARTHHHRHLRNPFGGEPRLVVEEASEVEAIRKDVRLLGKEYAARINQVHAGQMIFQRNFLRTDILFNGLVDVGAALHGSVVSRNNGFFAVDDTDTGNDARRRKLVVVHAVGGQRREFQKRSIRVDKLVDALTGQQFASFFMFFQGFFAAFLRDAFHDRAVLCQKGSIVAVVGFKLLGLRIDGCFEGIQMSVVFRSMVLRMDNVRKRQIVSERTSKILDSEERTDQASPLVVRCAVFYPAGNLVDLLIGEFAAQGHATVADALPDAVGVGEDVFPNLKVRGVSAYVATGQGAVG